MASIYLPPLPLSGFEVYETEPVEEDKEKENDKDNDKDSKSDSSSSKSSTKSKTTGKSNLPNSNSVKVTTKNISSLSKSDLKKLADGKTTDDDEETDEEETEETLTPEKRLLQKFVEHNGAIKETAYYDGMYKNGFDEDYEGISNGGSASFPEIDTKRFFIGKKICLKKENDTGKALEWKDLKSCLLGFISDLTFTADSVDLQLVGMTKLLDQEAEFTFQQTKMSEILKQMIETAGLKAKIDVTGLNDEVIDYTNVSSSSDDSDTSGAYSEDAGKLAKEVCKGKKTDRDKAQAIHTWIHKNVQYPTPNYSDHKKCPSEVIKSGYSNCCDRARLGHEMANAVNVTNRGVHGPNHVWLQYKLDGSWVDSDPGVSRPKLGSVYNGYSMNSTWDFPSC